MGAAEFFEYALAPTAEQAFVETHEQAAWEHGHGGYTGTLAEKGHFELFPLAKGLTADTLFDLLCGCTYDQRKRKRLESAYEPQVLTRLLQTFDDKWGPAVCVKLRGTEAAKVRKAEGRQRGNAWAFMGWASS